MSALAVTSERNRWWSPEQWPAGWPLMAALVFYPLWWALGLGALVFPIAAIPMAWQLRQRRHIEVPPWFGLWLLFVGWSLLGAIVLGVDAPDTLPTTFAQGLDAYVLRTLQYIGATVVLLYVGNLTEGEVPKLRIVKWLSVLFVSTLAGGYLGLAMPSLQWKSPVELLLPGPLAARRGIVSMVHPQVAQIQDVIGTGDPRPNAPFEFTNAWGNNLSILIIWFVIWALVYGAARRRMFGLLALGIAIVPIIYSLNRGLWLGLGVAVCYGTFRLAIAGRPWLIGALLGVAAVGLAVMAVTPLGNVVASRAEAGNSNQVRSSLAQASIDGGVASPLLGYGGTRETVGSDESIAIGATPECPRCGNRTIGSTGHAWNVLYSQGFVGLAAFLGFFIAILWRFRRDVSPIGLAAHTIIVVQLLYVFVYVGISSTLSLLMISVALLWRSERDRQQGYNEPEIPRLGDSGFRKLQPSWRTP
ncbi:MAG: O-antigen ligase family protein [Actinomycetes bacterium]